MLLGVLVGVTAPRRRSRCGGCCAPTTSEVRQSTKSMSQPPDPVRPSRLASLASPGPGSSTPHRRSADSCAPRRPTSSPPASRVTRSALSGPLLCPRRARSSSSSAAAHSNSPRCRAPRRSPASTPMRASGGSLAAFTPSSSRRSSRSARSPCCCRCWSSSAPPPAWRPPDVSSASPPCAWSAPPPDRSP